MRVELHLAVDWGVVDPALGRRRAARVREYLGRMADVAPRCGRRVVDEVGPRGDAHRRPHRSNAADGAGRLPRLRLVAVEDPAGRADKRRWIHGAEEEWGAWGTVYYDDDGRLLGSMQFGPSELFPRAAELPAGPPGSDAVLVTCAYLTDPAKPWVMQSLFLTAIGEARERGARALEAFAYRYSEGEGALERFHVHRTIFPSDFLADFGFMRVRALGRVELVRLELGGLQPVGRGHAREGAARRARRVRAGAGAAAALNRAVALGLEEEANRSSDQRARRT